MTISISAPIDYSRLGVGLVALGVAAVPVRQNRVRIRLNELVEMIERDGLLQLAVAFQILPLTYRKDDSVLWCIGDRALPGAALERMGKATEVAVIFATVGAAWGNAISAYFKCGDALSGYLLDEIGTAVLERFSLRLEALLRMTAHAQGLRSGSPFEPGHTGLPLTLQPMLGEVAKIQTAGMSVTSTGMISPSKSTSMLIGIGAGARRWTRAQSCRECPSFAQCHSQGRRSKTGHSMRENGGR